MSQARIKTSRFAARQGATLACQKCGEPIEKGEVYRWYFVGFRSRFKRVRCLRSGCTPRRSELESSAMAGAYSAVEGAEDALAALRLAGPEDDASSVVSAVEEAASGIREVADQYREADEAFGGGGMTQSGELADMAEEAADALEAFSPGEDQPDLDDTACDDHQDDSALESSDAGTLEELVEACEACQERQAEARQEWWDGLLDEADEALSEAGL